MNISNSKTTQITWHGNRTKHIRYYLTSNETRYCTPAAGFSIPNNLSSKTSLWNLIFSLPKHRSKLYSEDYLKKLDEKQARKKQDEVITFLKKNLGIYEKLNGIVDKIISCLGENSFMRILRAAIFISMVWGTTIFASPIITNCFVSSFFYNSSIRQNTLLSVNFLPSKFGIEVDSLNGPTPWEVLGNTYSQPNITKQIDKGDLEWYGSGDVNNDGKIDSLDLEEMNQGAQNIMADVNGDGHFSTQNDKNILSEYLSGVRNYLPGHWNELTTPEEREAWFDKMYRLQDRLNGSPPGWICQDWIRQHELKFYGCSNYEEEYNQGFWKPETNIDSVAKYNIPMYYFSTTSVPGVSHAVSGVLVGRRISPDSVSLNPLDFRDWSFRSYQQDERIYPGDFDIDPNSPVTMYKSAYVQQQFFPYNKFFTTTGPWIKWELNPTSTQ